MKYRFIEYRNGSVQIQKRYRFSPIWMPCNLPNITQGKDSRGNQSWTTIEQAKSILKMHLDERAKKKQKIKRIWPVDIVIREEPG